MAERIPIRLTINGTPWEGRVEPRRLLVDLIRQDVGLTGTHVGCEHGVCGACTVLMDGTSARSCITLAVQADGASITTVEGLAQTDGTLHALQEGFRACHGLQCGFCTPGILMAACDLLADNPDPSEAEVREGIAGNLCRCTGYQGIINAICHAAKRMGIQEEVAQR